jgi:phospholipid/cholesterol/gamma-HCH transport system substrate-binding protein
MQQVKFLRNPILWGAGALGFLTVLALVAAFLYISPPDQKVVTFYTNDSASIRPGDQVRIAGISVGTVKDLSLASDQVRIRAMVDDAAFVGDESQVQVRMLTVVGGYYVNIVSIGDTPLGARSIPSQRVTMPYNLVRALTDSTKLTENIATKPLNESLNEIQQGLTGSNVDALSAIIDAGNTVMSTIDKQRGQVTAILNLSNEYIGSLNNFREELVRIVQKVAILQSTLVLYSKGFGSALSGLGDILDAIKPIGLFYDNHRDRFLETVRDYEHKVRLFVERNGVTVHVLHVLQDKLNRILDTENAPPELLATDLCIPLPGSPC